MSFLWLPQFLRNGSVNPSAFLFHIFCEPFSHKVCVPVPRSLASRELPPLFEVLTCIGVRVQDNSIQGRFLSLRNSDSQIGTA